MREAAEEYGIVQEGRVYEPTTFQMGKNQIVPGVEKALLGKKVGDVFEVTVDPDDGYGRDTDYPSEVVSIELFRHYGIEPEEGMELETDRGFARVEKIEGDKITLQYFHPLAGARVIFWVRVEDVKKPEG